jgi:hypothetical protein
VVSYAAVLSAVTWGVDFAQTAVMRNFDCIDLVYDADYPEERWADAQREIAFVRGLVSAVVDTQGPVTSGSLPNYSTQSSHTTSTEAR